MSELPRRQPVDKVRRFCQVNEKHNIDYSPVEVGLGSSGVESANQNKGEVIDSNDNSESFKEQSKSSESN